MDTLSLKTQLQEDGRYAVSWQWWQGKTQEPHAGLVHVSVDPSHDQDRALLAELRALYYLLEDRKIHGQNRLGNGIRIEVSAGAVRKALLKGSLKSTGVGKTQKPHVAAAVDFLATKYFEAEIEVGRWREVECRSNEQAIVEQGRAFLRPLISCALLNMNVVVTRHAMARYVARIDQKLDRHTEDDLSGVADSRWSAAWRWLEKILSNQNLQVAKLRPEARQRLAKRYGAGTQYLCFPDAQVVLIFQRDRNACVLATVMSSETAGFLEKEAYIVGQSIVRGHIHERAKANRG